MEALTLKTNLHCNSCVNKVEPILVSNSDIEVYSIDLEHPDKIIPIRGNDLNSQDLISKFHDAGYHAEVTSSSKNSFWKRYVTLFL